MRPPLAQTLAPCDHRSTPNIDLISTFVMRELSIRNGIAPSAMRKVRPQKRMRRTQIPGRGTARIFQSVRHAFSETRRYLPNPAARLRRESQSLAN